MEITWNNSLHFFNPPGVFSCFVRFTTGEGSVSFFAVENSNQFAYGVWMEHRIHEEKYLNWWKCVFNERRLFI